MSGDPDTEDPADEDPLFSITEADVRSIFEIEDGPWRTHVTTMHIHHSTVQDSSVEGTVLHDGQPAGKFRRKWGWDFQCEMWVMRHESLGLNDGTETQHPLGINYQRRGFSSIWLPHCFERYREWGFGRVTVRAANAGCVAWAKLGFEVNNAQWTELIDWAEGQIAELREDGHIDEAEHERRVQQIAALRRSYPDLMDLMNLHVDAHGRISVLESHDWDGHLTL